MRACFRIAVVLGWGLLPLAAAAQGKVFTADDLPKIVRLSDPQISPDGRTVALVVARAEMKEDRWESELDTVDVGSMKLTVLTHDRMGVGSPRWSPKGDKLAFLAQDGNKKAQIYLLSMTGGDAAQVTHTKTAVVSFVWRPDGEGFAYAVADETPEKKDEAKFEDAFEVGNNDFTARSRPEPTHVWLTGLSGEAKRLTSGAWSLPNRLPGASPQLAWTPDGKGLLVTKADSPLTGDAALSRLVRVDVASGEVKPFTGTNTEEDVAKVSNDGRLVAYMGSRNGRPEEGRSLFVTTVHGGAGKDAAYALDRSIGGAEWMPDGRLLVWGGNHTHPALWVQTVAGGATQWELGGLSPQGAVAVGEDGSVAFTATTADAPAELYYARKPGEAPVALTHLQNVTEGLSVARQETVHWTSDTFDVNGVLTYPVGYVAGKKYPLVLYIHGGPNSESVETWTPAAQILAGKGWLVLEPNYRGSNADGSAFERAGMGTAGAATGPGRDIVAGVKMLQARGLVQEGRIATTGWSEGGYLTSWLIGRYPEMWAAAIAGAPVTDLVDEYAESDILYGESYIFGPSPFVGNGMELYRRESPITYAAKVKTPTLILNDVGDYRVPTPQVYKFYHALKDNGVTVKYVIYPVTGHSPADPIRARDVWRRWTSWLAPYLDGTAAKP